MEVFAEAVAYVVWWAVAVKEVYAMGSGLRYALLYSWQDGRERFNQQSALVWLMQNPTSVVAGFLMFGGLAYIEHGTPMSALGLATMCGVTAQYARTTFRMVKVSRKERATVRGPR